MAQKLSSAPQEAPDSEQEQEEQESNDARKDGDELEEE